MIPKQHYNTNTPKTSPLTQPLQMTRGIRAGLDSTAAPVVVGVLVVVFALPLHLVASHRIAAPFVRCQCRKR